MTKETWNLFHVSRLFMSDYILLQSQRQWSDCHWSHSFSQSTATKQANGRIEVSYKVIDALNITVGTIGSDCHCLAEKNFQD